jgi:small subunit ribosomal protein S6
MTAQKQYELVYIASPDATEDQLTELQSLIEGIITKANGTIDKADIWGRRRLAYEIAKHAEGIYAVVDVKAEPATVSELDRQLNLNESVLRTKVLRTDKH